MAGGDHPRRDHAEALQLRGDRRHHCGAHHLHSRSARLGPHLGLPLSAGCATPISWSARSTASARRARWRTSSPTSWASSPAMTGELQPVYSIVLDRPDGGAHRRRPEGLSRRRPGAHRQRRRSRRTSTTPTAASSSPRCRCSSTSGCRGRATRPVPPAGDARREGLRSWRSSPTPASGNSASRSASTPIRRRCAGPAATGSAAIAAHLGLADRAAYWDARGRRSSAELLEQAWNPEARRFTRGIRHATISMPACCCCPSSA